MKKYNYIVAIGIVLGVVTLAFGAVGDKLFRSTTNFIIDSGSNVQILTDLRADKVTGVDGSATLPGWVPVGGMLAVMPSANSNAWQPDSGCAIKDGYVRAGNSLGTTCVVPTCSDCGIPAGTTLPNMNNKFIRGNTTSNTSGGGNVVVSEANLYTNTISTFQSGVQSAPHAHTTSHTHGTTTDGNSDAHGHSQNHSHSYVIGADSNPHTHYIDSYNGGIHEHANLINGSGESMCSGYSSNGGPARAVFRFPAPKVNQTNYWDDQFIAWTATNNHTHTFNMTIPAGTHNHSGGASPSSGGSGNNSQSHNHGTKTDNSLFTSTESTNHSHSASFTFPNASQQAVDTTPTNITVVWVIRVR